MGRSTCGNRERRKMVRDTAYLHKFSTEKNIAGTMTISTWPTRTTSWRSFWGSPEKRRSPFRREKRPKMQKSENYKQTKKEKRRRRGYSRHLTMRNPHSRKQSP